jgi:hypothetical protein
VLLQVSRVFGQELLGQLVQHLHGGVAVMHQTAALYCRVTTTPTHQHVNSFTAGISIG